MKNITVNIATRKGRERSLKITISSLIAQTLKPNRINVYVNDYDMVGYDHDRVHVMNHPHGDLGAKAKFWFLSHAEGYYLTCDDDIRYNADYVETMAKKLEADNGKAYCVHGTNYGKGKKKFYDYKNSQVIDFQGGLNQDTEVMIGGTGTMAFDVDIVGRELFHQIEGNNMCDIYVNAYLKSIGIPVISIARRRHWLTENRDSQDEHSIWRGVANNDKKQSEILNKYW